MLEKLSKQEFKAEADFSDKNGMLNYLKYESICKVVCKSMDYVTKRFNAKVATVSRGRFVHELA